MSTNDFLPFCETDTGTNLLTESEYTAAPHRTVGNQPGVASAKLVNKALRQATFVVSQLGQYLANQLGTNVLDNAVPEKLLAQMNAALGALPPVFSTYAPGNGTHHKTFVFFIVGGNASAGAVYSNNGANFTVKSSIVGQIVLNTTGDGEPALEGTLTKVSGTGDSSLTFYAVRSAVYYRVQMSGAGGGGGAPGSGGAGGGATTFGSSFLTANGGTAGSNTGEGGIGGTASAPSGAYTGGNGAGAPAASTTATGTSGSGGANIFSGVAGGQYNSGATGQVGIRGGGGAGGSSGVGVQGGGGGGAGGAVDIIVSSPAASYSYSIGTGGAAGAQGGGNPAGAGGNGFIQVSEFFQ